MNKVRTREHFIRNITKGNIVAFTVLQNGNKKMLSGRIISIDPTAPFKFVVKTRNGSVFFVNPQDITWVKTGTKWPLGIYNALKYDKEEKQHGKEVRPGGYNR